jgi:predicted transcriptional regulator
MKKNISISMDVEKLKKIDEICRISERTKTWVIEKAVDNYLEDLEDAEIALERSLSTEKSGHITEEEIKKEIGM